MKYWEIIADNLHDAGWSLGWVSAIDSQGRTIWIVDAHRDDGKRFVVRGDFVTIHHFAGLRIALLPSDSRTTELECRSPQFPFGEV